MATLKALLCVRKVASGGHFQSPELLGFSKLQCTPARRHNFNNSRVRLASSKPFAAWRWRAPAGVATLQLVHGVAKCIIHTRRCRIQRRSTANTRASRISHWSPRFISTGVAQAMPFSKQAAVRRQLPPKTSRKARGRPRTRRDEVTDGVGERGGGGEVSSAGCPRPGGGTQSTRRNTTGRAAAGGGGL